MRGCPNVTPSDSIDRQDRLRSVLSGILVFGIAALLFVSIFVIKPTMPDRIALLTGPEDSAYHDLGVRYADDLQRRGLEVEVITTKGALDNVRQLADGRKAVAFAESAVDWEKEAGIKVSSVVALGSVGFEPSWLFYRSSLPISRVSDLANRIVLTEGRGTSSHHVAEVLIEKNDLAGQIQLQSIDREQSLDRLIESLTVGHVDAILVTGHPSSARVNALLHADGVNLLSFDRADAYVAQVPGIASLAAPEGIFDLAHNIPRQDSRLLAKTTCLIAHKEIHPAVIPMLLVTAENIRQSEIKFPSATAFPNSKHLALPLHQASRRYFKQGEVGLSKYLPYKVTRFLNHLGLFVIPLLTGVIVLVKIIPVCLKIWTGFRIKRLFKQLETVEKKHAAGDDSSALLAELDRISGCQPEKKSRCIRGDRHRRLLPRRPRRDRSAEP